MARILALGELLVEIMRPGSGEPLDQPGIFHGPFVSGAPGIFALACARLGLPTALLGSVGADAFGRLIQRQAREDGLEHAFLRTVASAPTGCAFVAYDRYGKRDFIFHVRGSAAAAVAPDWPPTELLESIDWLHLCGSTLAVSDEWWQVAWQAARRVRERGAHVSFDPNVRPELLGGRTVEEVCGPLLRLADIILPSGDEAIMLTAELTAEAGCIRLLEFGADLVVLKRGANGATVFTAAQQVEVDPYRVDEVDPTGAGDIFAAGLACALLRGTPLLEAVDFACAAGALAVTRQGPLEGAPHHEEVLALQNSAL